MPQSLLFGLLDDAKDSEEAVDEISVVEVESLLICDLLQVDLVVGDEFPHGLHVAGEDGEGESGVATVGLLVDTDQRVGADGLDGAGDVLITGDVEGSPPTREPLVDVDLVVVDEVVVDLRMIVVDTDSQQAVVVLDVVDVYTLSQQRVEHADISRLTGLEESLIEIHFRTETNSEIKVK